MKETSFLLKHPLLLLHLGCWFVYILGDSVGHLASGYSNVLPSIACGLSACLLTGVVALASKQLAHLGLKIQGAIFGFLLYLAAIVWDKLLIILHTEEQSTVSDGLQKVKNYSLVDWFLPNYEALFVFIAWGGFLLACTYFIAHREQQVRLGVALLQTKQAQLQTLRYQLNPHFLFNVLNSVDVSVLSEDKDTAHQMLKHLSRFLRNSLQQGEQDKIKLEQEFEVLSDFVSIEQLRFGDALQLDMELSDVCRAAMLPPMLLQPLVENAIKFAWSQTEKGQVQVTARKQDQQLVIEINNSKVGLSEKRSGTGTGLRNTLERLRLVYGEDASLLIEDLPDQYQLLLTLPFEIAL